MKTVKVHKCFSIDLGEQPPPSRKPKRKKGQPQYQGRICTCREVVSMHTAQEWLDQGLAEWLDFEKSIGVRCRAKQTPRGATIEESHIERAYVDYAFRDMINRCLMGSVFDHGKLIKKYDRDKCPPEIAKEERERIDQYGGMVLIARTERRFQKDLTDWYFLEKPSIQELIKKILEIRKEEPEGGFENDRGRPLFSRTTDERTPGGIGVDVYRKFDTISIEAKQ